MNLSLRELLCLLCLIVTTAGVPRAAAAQEFSWSADRPLTWDDFAGAVDERSAPEDVAVTAASLSWAYEYEFERSLDACIYRITDIRADAVFHPSNSWVKPGHRTADVLEHEQGHFDIAQIHKLMFVELSRDLVGPTKTCSGKNSKRIAKSIENEIEQLAAPVYEQVWQNHTKLQLSYDDETNHGMRAAAQQSWLVTIAAGLRGHGGEKFRLGRARY